MARRRSPGARIRSEFDGLIDALELEPLQKRFLTSRWLDQVAWMEAKAEQARNRYYRLRLTTVVGAVTIPALVSVSSTNDSLDFWLRVATWAVSLIVAVSAAVEQFFQFGPRWRNYRHTVERLKTEGWLYVELSGAYREAGATHAAAFPAFAGRVEALISSDVDTYITEITAEKGTGGKG